MSICPIPTSYVPCHVCACHVCLSPLFSLLTIFPSPTKIYLFSLQNLSFFPPCPTMSHHVPPCPTMSYHVPPCLTMEDNVLSCPIMSFIRRHGRTWWDMVGHGGKNDRFWREKRRSSDLCAHIFLICHLLELALIHRTPSFPLSISYTAHRTQSCMSSARCGPGAWPGAPTSHPPRRRRLPPKALDAAGRDIPRPRDISTAPIH